VTNKGNLNARKKGTKGEQWAVKIRVLLRNRAVGRIHSGARRKKGKRGANRQKCQPEPESHDQLKLGRSSEQGDLGQSIGRSAEKRGSLGGR